MILDKIENYVYRKGNSIDKPKYTELLSMQSCLIPNLKKN